jgi:hypothetical protein
VYVAIIQLVAPYLTALSLPWHSRVIPNAQSESIYSHLDCIQKARKSDLVNLLLKQSSDHSNVLGALQRLA